MTMDIVDELMDAHLSYVRDGVDGEEGARMMKVAVAEIERLRALTTWHRIDDPDNPPPKDGTVIWAWHVAKLNQHAAFDANIKKAQWLPDCEEWRVEGVGGNVPPVISHWMSLPTPPEDRT